MRRCIISGFPTTRALSLVGTGDAVMRDMFYNGNVKPEPGAIVCRVAPSLLDLVTSKFFLLEMTLRTSENWLTLL